MFRKKTPSYLNFLGIELKFIYSFLISFQDFDNIIDRLTDKEKCGEEGIYKEEAYETREGQLTPTIKISREDGCLVLSKECEKGSYLVISKNETTINDLKVHVSTSARIHDSGMGTLTVSLKNSDSKRQFTISDFNLLFRLVERVSKGNNFADLQEEGKESTFRLEELFKTYFKELKIQLGDLIRKDNIISSEGSNASTISQVPFIITTGKISQKYYEKVFISGDRISNNIRNEISLLLLRVIDIGNGRNTQVSSKDLANINLLYVKEYFDFDEKKNIPMNLAMDNRMYYQFHPRCCLILTSDTEIPPSHFMIPSIQNTLEITRTRWFSGILINSKLDALIHKIRSDDYNPTKAETLNEIIDIKGLYSQLLENPVIYGFEGGSVTAIAKIAEKKMWLQEIIDLTTEKLRIMDQILEGKKATYYAKNAEQILKR